MSNPTAKPHEEEQQLVFKKPQPAHIGASAERSCTNCCWLIVFAAVWVGFIAFAGVAFSNGNINRLIYGVDYLGNICGPNGQGNNATAAAKATWSSKQFLYYPVGFNSATGAFNIDDARHLGVCVAACPAAGDSVATYSEVRPAALPAEYLSLFDTAPKFHRCVPAFLTYNCSNSSASSAAGAACSRNKESASSLFDTVAGFGDVAAQGFNEVRARWWVLVVCAILTIVFSFLWLFILKRAVKPVVVVSLLLVLVVVGLVAGFCLREYKRISDLPAGDADMKKTYLAIGVSAAVVDFLLLCLVLYLRSDIMVACDINEEAAKIPVQIPTMLLVPPALVLLLVPLLIFFLFVGANIYTASSTLTLTVPSLNYNGSLQNTTLTVAAQTFSNWRPWGFAFTIFVFLWTYGFIHAVGFLVIAMCAVFWYWSKPGSPKEPQHGVAKALALTLRFHLGTAALGSLIIAVIQMLRIAVACLENRLRTASKNSDGVRCIVCCAQCCLACFEAIVKFINKNAYIVQAMTGEPFVDAAKHALSLLMHNIASVGAVTVISEYVMMFSNIIITGISLGIGYLILAAQADFSSAGLIFMLIFVGIVSYFVASVFMGVFGVCIDTVLLSYCYDLEQNNGQGRPYFFPDDLAQHIDAAKARMSERLTTDTKKFEVEADYKAVEQK